MSLPTIDLAIWRACAWQVDAILIENFMHRGKDHDELELLLGKGGLRKVPHFLLEIYPNTM